MTSTGCKLVTYTGASVLAASTGYVVAAWVMIYGLKPEHPEISPLRLFRGAMSHLPTLVLLFTVFQLVALAFVFRRISGIHLGDLVATAAEVSGLLALIHGSLVDFTALDSSWWWLVVASCPINILSTVALILLKKEYGNASGA